jgi:hypothetical protein
MLMRAGRWILDWRDWVHAIKRSRDVIFIYSVTRVKMPPAKSRNLAHVWANVGFVLFILNCLWSGSLIQNYLATNDPPVGIPSSFLLLLMSSVVVGVLVGALIGMSIPSDQQFDPEVAALLLKHRTYGSTCV